MLPNGRCRYQWSVWPQYTVTIPSWDRQKSVRPLGVRSDGADRPVPGSRSLAPRRAVVFSVTAGHLCRARGAFEDEEEFDCNRWDDEEAYRDQLLSMVLEKGPPGLRRRITVPDQVFGDRRLRPFDSNLPQFSVKARSAPARVGKAHLTNKIPNFCTCGWAAQAGRLFHFQWSRNPMRCQAMTVSGLTMSNADRQPFHNCESQTQSTRSAQRRDNRWPRPARCRTKRGRNQSRTIAGVRFTTL